jgi:hypothetical protein
LFDTVGTLPAFTVGPAVGWFSLSATFAESQAIDSLVALHGWCVVFLALKFDV